MIPVPLNLFLKLAALSVNPILNRIWNASLKSVIFPALWKRIPIAAVKEAQCGPWGALQF